MSTTDQFWDDCRPDDEEEAFNERSAARSDIIDQATTRLDNTDRLSPQVWAFCQVADLKVFQERATPLWWETLADRHGEAFWDSSVLDAIKLWRQLPEAKSSAKSGSKKRTASVAFNESASSPPAPPQTPASSDGARTRSRQPTGSRNHSVGRDTKVAELCKERDRQLCAVSSVDAVEAAHIYPWCAFRGGRNQELVQQRVKNFWKILSMFWPLEKVESWKAKLFCDDRSSELRATETVENMITLTRTLHSYHSHGAFALRPIRMSKDKKELELEFHWLDRVERAKSEKMRLETVPPSSRHLSGSGLSKFFQFKTEPAGQLHSGYRFRMTTDDVDTKPLPDPGLLELQWYMQRVMAMSGACGWKDEDEDEDDTTDLHQWLENDEPIRSRCSTPGPADDEY